MKPKAVENESKAKKELGIKDFNLLSATGTLGFYRECELNHIFIIEKETGHLYHYFAICSYEEFSENDSSLREKKLIDKLFPVNNCYSMGIIQYRINFEESCNIFTQLCNDSLTFKGKNVIMPKDYQLLPKAYVPGLWGYDGVMINKILKPNFWGDKYIIEFISNQNPMKSIFTATEFDEINSKILELLPINLSVVYDRIGSFIFQFPITLISGYANISSDWSKAKLSIDVHPDFMYSNDLCTIVNTRLDNIVTGFNTIDGLYSEMELDLGDSNNLEFMIFNKKNKLIYRNTMSNFMKNIQIDGLIGTQNAEPRTFKDSNQDIISIELFSSITSGRSAITAYENRITYRIRQNEIINKSGRYMSFYSDERDKALEYIRKILNDTAPNCSEIWLWDPFLRQIDISETLYYINMAGIIMKCITSFKNNKRQDNEEDTVYDDFKKNQQKAFVENSNNRGINIEFRAVYKKGFEFHDRFLFCIPQNPDEIPTVYSLGTSVNSIGKTHHLIQQTLDPKNIVIAFRELWKLLDNDESLIIKLPQEN